MFSFLKKALIAETDEKASIVSIDVNSVTSDAMTPDTKLSSNSISQTESSTSNGDRTLNTVSADNNSEALDTSFSKVPVELEDFEIVLQSAASSAEVASCDDRSRSKIATSIPVESVIVSKSANFVVESNVNSLDGSEILPSSRLESTRVYSIVDINHEVVCPALVEHSACASKTDNTRSTFKTAEESTLNSVHIETVHNNVIVIADEKKPEKKLEINSDEKHEGKYEEDDISRGTHTATNSENAPSEVENSKNDEGTKIKVDGECEISEVDISSISSAPLGVLTEGSISQTESDSINLEGMKALSLGGNAIISGVAPCAKKDASSSHPLTSSLSGSGSTDSTSSHPSTGGSVIIKIEKVSASDNIIESAEVTDKTLKNGSEMNGLSSIATKSVTNAVNLGLVKGKDESEGMRSSSEFSPKTDIPKEQKIEENILMTDIPKRIMITENATSDEISQVKEKVIIDLTGDDDVTVGITAKREETRTNMSSPKSTRSYPHVVDLTGDSPTEEDGSKDPDRAHAGQGTETKWAPGLAVWETCLNELVELEAMAVAHELDHEGSEESEEGETYGGGSDDISEDRDLVYGADYEDEVKDDEYSGYSLSDEEGNGYRSKASGAVNGRSEGEEEEEDDEVAGVYIADDDEMISYEDNAEEFEAQSSESGPKFTGFASEQEASSRDISPPPPSTGGVSDKLPIDAYREVILERIKVINATLCSVARYY